MRDSEEKEGIMLRRVLSCRPALGVRLGFQLPVLTGAPQCRRAREHMRYA